MPEESLQVNSESFTPLFIYALTHAHGRQWLRAIPMILQRREVVAHG